MSGPDDLLVVNRNAMRRWNFERMNVLQQLFARPCFFEEEVAAKTANGEGKDS